MRPPTARPKRMARSTAPRLSTGSTPGSARSTAQAWALGSAPKVVAAPEKIFDRVLSWAWVSSPMTISQSLKAMAFASESGAGAGWPVCEDGPQVVVGAAAAHLLALVEGHCHAVALLPHAHDAAVAGVLELEVGQPPRLAEILQVETAGAAVGHGDDGVEGAHVGVVDRQFHAARI